MIAAFWTGKALAGTGEFPGKTALVTFIDRCIGTVVRHALIAVIPDIFQRPQIVLQIGILAITDETAARQRGMGRLKVQFVIRVDLLFHIQMETVGVVPFIGHPVDNTELGGVQPAEAVAQVFARGAVQAETIIGFLLPIVGRRLQPCDDRQRFYPVQAGDACH